MSWVYVPNEGVLVNPDLSTDLTEEAKDLKRALQPVQVLPKESGEFQGLVATVFAALIAQRALLLRLFPDTDFEVIRLPPADCGYRHTCAWRPQALTSPEQYDAWEKEVAW